MKNTGFIGTFIAVCSGTEVFPELVKRPFLKAVICGCVNVAFRLHPFNKEFEECCTNLSRRFGKIEFSDKGITPTIRPEESHSASYNDFRVDYLVDSEALKTYKPDKEFNKGIVWTPEIVLLWLNLMEGEEWTVFPILIPTSPSKSLTEMLALYKELSKGKSSNPPFYVLYKMYSIPPFENSELLAFNEFKSNVFFWIPMTIPVFYSVFLFAYIIVNCLIFSPIYILFFTAFSYMFGKSNTMNMKFSELYISGIYTGFPGLIIATLYVALNLPGMDFQSIFLISYFIYSFAVFSRLRLEGDKQRQNKNPKDNN